MYVYVQGQNGNALMPTTRCAHVRHLLKSGRARVVKQKPFTIRLLYACPEGTQPLHGGTDPGRTNEANAVANEQGQVVYADHVETQNSKIPDRMKDRARHRRASRSGERKRRQRRAKKHGTEMIPSVQERVLPGCKEPIVIHGIINSEARFANRQRPAGWLTPTARHLVETHLNMVRKICSILPVTDWTIEINRFAFMQLEDGTVRGVDFQNGRMKNYASVKDYIFAEQEGVCRLCGSPIEHYHHIVPRSENGSDGPENIIGLCADCHRKVHTDNKTKRKIAKIGKKKAWSALSVLNQAIPYVWAGLVELFGEEHVHSCFGWETKAEREAAGLPKDHYVDAACIAAIGAGISVQPFNFAPFEVKQYRRHDRAIINHQCRRCYQIPNGTTKKGKVKWKTVAWNRKKATAQEDVSLDEYIATLPADERQYVLSNLRVVPSKRYYNDRTRNLPGTVFWFEGRRYVMSGRKNNGDYLRAEGMGKRDFPADKCRIVPSGGLVYL